MTLSGSTLYGMTQQGGLYYSGTIFSVPDSGGAPTVLASLSCTNYENPPANLALVGNTLYGTLNGTGDPDGNGSIFSINTNGTGLRYLLNFSGTNGSYSYGGLMLSGNTLYGRRTTGVQVMEGMR